MNRKIFKIIIFLLLLSSCDSCKDDDLSNGILWKVPLNQKSLIYDEGVGYPIYKNTVVFHSTPEPWGDIRESILHGLDTETGEEKWRLTNSDFSKKKDFRLMTLNPYQKDNILIDCDFVNTYMYSNLERYIYGIDIEKGKVLWETKLPDEYNLIGYSLCGRGQFVYVDASTKEKVSVLRVDIETGNLTTVFTLSNEDLPEEIGSRNPKFVASRLTNIYQDNKGDDYIACRLMSDMGDHWAFSICVYNLTKKIKVYVDVITQEDGEGGQICYQSGKLIVGNWHSGYCYDAFEKKKYWEKSVIFNDGVGNGSGNDEVMRVLGYENLAFIFCVDRLVCFDLNTGAFKYNVPAGWVDARMIDGVMYNIDDSDLVMRDPYTGKELKRAVATPGEQVFASMRPNGADGRIFIHSYSHAYCLKAYSK